MSATWSRDAFAEARAAALTGHRRLTGSAGAALAAALGGLVLATPLAGQDTVPAARWSIVEEGRLEPLISGGANAAVPAFLVPLSRSVLVVYVTGPVSSAHLFHPSGRYLRSVAVPACGKGQGSITGAGLLPGDRFALWYPGSGCIAVCVESGTCDRTVQTSSRMFSSEAFRTGPDGSFYVQMPPRKPGPTIEAQRYLHLSATGKELALLELPPERTDDGVLISRPDRTLHSFTRGVISTLGADGTIVTGFNASYAFEIRRPQDTTRVSRPDWTPTTLAGDERREWLRFLEHARNTPGPPLNASIPRTKPAYRSFWIDADGRIWVERYVAAEKRILPRAANRSARPRITWLEPLTYDVFTPAGEFLAEVVLPEGTWLLWASANQVWLGRIGEAGEASVVRARLRS